MHLTTTRSMQLSRARAATPRRRRATIERSPTTPIANGGLARAYDWTSAGGDVVARPPPLTPRADAGPRRFAFTENAAAADTVVGIVGRALATDPVTVAYALPGKEQRYCEAALRAGLLTDSVGRDRRLWLSECGRAAAVAYRCVGAGAEASASLLPVPPPLPLLAGAQRAALTAQALTSLKPGEPARACARAATALARVRGAYCAAVERNVDMSLTASVVVAYISVLAVDPEVQGRGLGTRLLKGVLRELLLPLGPPSASAAPTTTATTHHAYVEASSERSAALYRRLGFRVIACVDADGTVRTGADAAGGGGGGGEDEDGGEWTRTGGVPRAPTLVLASALDGRFREWLVGGGEGEERL